jgi:GNAT superfamily N-acetyltransferase
MMKATTRAISVTPVESAADGREFCELPYRLYSKDPCWVPPLRCTELERWSAQKNASLASRWCRRFLARVDGQPAGRIAAIVDPEFCNRWEADAGFFGFFECIDDRAAAAGLVEAVERELRGKGKTTLLGPVNLTTHGEVGLLVDGFDSPPMVLSPYNPPYYEGLLSSCSFSGRADYHAYSWHPGTSRAAALDRLLGRFSRRHTSSECVRLRSMDPSRRDVENRLLFQLYNVTFASRWGFVPLTWQEFAERADVFQSFYRPEYVTLAEVADRAVGFALALPDVNEALAAVKGRLFPFGWLRLAVARRRLGGVRLMLLGVLPEFRGRGIAALLAEEQAKAARRLRARRVELSLVHENNKEMQHVISAFGGVRCKTYRLFEKGL